jgi:hypothetical protein
MCLTTIKNGTRQVLLRQRFKINAFNVKQLEPESTLGLSGLIPEGHRVKVLCTIPDIVTVNDKLHTFLKGEVTHSMFILIGITICAFKRNFSFTATANIHAQIIGITLD